MPGNEAMATRVTRNARRRQLAAIAAGALILGVDGFDIISVSVAAPGIAIEWGLDRAQLGWLLATEVMGAAMGAAVLGHLADIHGRRTIILACLLVMAAGMALTAVASDPLTLAAIRLVTGIGLGGLNPAVTSMVSEVASEPQRDKSVAALGLGYAIGAIIGGASASWLLSSESWRVIFVAGSLFTGVSLLVATRFIPETLAPRALTRHATTPIGLHEGAAGDAGARTVPREGGMLLRGRNGRNAALLTLASMGQLSTFYFSLKWLPKLAVDAGMSVSAGASVLTIFNVGGLAGMLAMAPLARLVGLKAFTMSAFISSGGAILVLALSLGQPLATMATACLTGMLANAAFGGLYASVARAFPSELRSTGIGLTLGLGRGGAAFAPIITGILFNLGATVPSVALAMTFTSVAAAFLVAFATIEH